MCEQYEAHAGVSIQRGRVGVDQTLISRRLGQRDFDNLDTAARWQEANAVAAELDRQAEAS